MRQHTATSTITAAVVAAAFLLAAPAAAQAPDAEELSALAKAVAAAQEGELRTEKERARDANRKPAETLEFFRMRPDMKVLELVPGGGWYTKILAPVLRENGSLAIAVAEGRAFEALQGKEGFEKLRRVSTGLDIAALARGPRENNRIALPEFEFAEGGFDLALTFRNLHNFTADGRRHMNAAVFATLVPGGYYGVVDHTRRHMQPDGAEVWRRMDPVEMIMEIEAAGFVFTDWSPLHYRADDELRYEVGRKTVTGNTDRFTLLFQKPPAAAAE